MMHILRQPEMFSDARVDHFDEFWAIYPRHMAKADARKAWKQVCPTAHDLDAIKTALAWQVEQPSWREGFIPLAATYLRGRRWEDEPFQPVQFRATPAELKQAREVRRQIGYCPHDPPCANSEACVGVIVQHWHAKQTRTV